MTRPRLHIYKKPTALYRAGGALLLLAAILLWDAWGARADQATSTSFILEDGAISAFGGEATSTGFSLQSGGESGTGQSSSTSFLVRMGSLDNSGFESASRNWRWYDDEGSVTPTSSLAAENTAPTNIEFQNIVKLRFTLKETSGIGSSGAKFRLQFSEASDFSSGVGDVAESGGCQPGSRWCYADGGGADSAVISARLLSDSDTDGTHNESGTSSSSFTHPANAAVEYEFTVRHAGANSNTAYFFRAFDTGANVPVPLDTGEIYPSLVTGGSSLTFVISGVGRSVVTEGIETDATSTATTIPFGTLFSDFETEAAQRFVVSTNATRGYQIFAFQDQALLNSFGDNIPPLTSTNSSPAGWTSVCVTTTTGCYGYHAGDDTLAGGSARFAADDTYARFEAQPREVAYSSGPVSDEATHLVFKLQVRNGQQSGAYQHSLTYIIVPVF